MQPKIKVEVVREKSFDPHFHVKIHYETEGVRLANVPISVIRRAPKVMFDHPPEILEHLSEEARRKLELEIMNHILEHIMHHAEQTNVAMRDTRRIL